MSARRPGSTLKLHLTLLAGWALCGVAGWIEWRRALGGNELSWAYAFEWPLFAVLGTWIWWRLLREALGRGPALPRRPRRRTSPEVAEDDPGLVAWRSYLQELGDAERRKAPPA